MMTDCGQYKIFSFKRHKNMRRQLEHIMKKVVLAWFRVNLIARMRVKYIIYYINLLLLSITRLLS